MSTDGRSMRYLGARITPVARRCSEGSVGGTVFFGKDSWVRLRKCRSSKLPSQMAGGRDIIKIMMISQGMISRGRS